MPTATVTVRTVKNKTTGIDLTVPTYREVPGRLSSTYFYHVVVVTNLSVFKSPKHKETDTVQFMMEKKFVDFEELRDRLNEKFSGTLFPTLPKRVLRENEAVARLRRGELEHFVKFLATVPKMVTSPVVLEFLGVGSIKAGTFRHGSVEDGGKQKKDSAKEEDESETKDADETPNEPETTLFEEDDKDDVDELFLEENSEETEDTTQIFDEQDFGGGISKDDDDSALFLPDAVVEKKTVITVVEETDPSLYQFDNDDLEQILKTEVKKKSKESENKKVSETAQKPLDKPKPPLKPKPGAKPDLKPKPGSKPDLKPKPSEPKPEENFSSDDILQYISQNSTADDDDDVDLFS